MIPWGSSVLAHGVSIRITDRAMAVAKFSIDNFMANLSVQAWESGSWTEIEQIPYNVGGNEDPILAMNDAVDGDGSGVEGASLEVLARGQSYHCGGYCMTAAPADLLVGTGTAGPDGKIHVPIDMTQAEADGTGYIAPDGNADLYVLYDANYNCDTDSDPTCDDTPDWEDSGVDVNEYFGTNYDAIVAQQTVLDSSGDPETDQDVAVQILPQSDADPGTDPVTIGSGETDSAGHPHVLLNTLDQEGDSNYENADSLAMTLEVKSVDSSEAQH